MSGRELSVVTLFCRKGIRSLKRLLLFFSFFLFSFFLKQGLIYLRLAYKSTAGYRRPLTFDSSAFTISALALQVCTNTLTICDTRDPTLSFIHARQAILLTWATSSGHGSSFEKHPGSHHI